jgi:hypothetical protein
MKKGSGFRKQGRGRNHRYTQINADYGLRPEAEDGGQ